MAQLNIFNLSSSYRTVMTRFLTFILITSLVFGCTQPEENNIEEARLAISNAAKAFSQAYIDGDLEAQMEFYTEDAVILPGTRNMVEGIEKITNYWDIPESIKVLKHKSTPVKLEVSGSMASDYGYYEGVSVNNGDTVNFRGQYVIVWKKGEDGKWRMAVDMWAALNN